MPTLITKCISLTLAVSLITTSCAHQPPAAFDQAITAGRCEDALTHVNEMQSNLKFTGQANRAAGTALSYTATGAGYVADVVLTVTGGTLIFLLLCAPAMAVTSVSGGGGNPGCIPADLSGIARPRTGRDTYKSTEEWRCPDLTALARAIRKVASCQETRKTPEATKSALTTLRSMTKNPDFMNCIVSDERSQILGDIYRLSLVAGG